MGGGACEPYWMKSTNLTKDCPFGKSIPFFDVTLPSNAGQGMDFWESISVAYGFVPHLFGLILLLRLLWRRGTNELCMGTCAIIVNLINEFLIKNMINQPRPGQLRENIVVINGVEHGTCNTSCGMPSSHSLMAILLFLLFVADAVGQSLQNPFKRAWFMIAVCVYCIALLPVPVSRVILYDHTQEQAFVGTLIACILGLPWIVAIQYANKRFAPRHGEALWEVKGFVVVRHNLTPPLTLFLNADDHPVVVREGQNAPKDMNDVVHVTKEDADADLKFHRNSIETLLPA